MALAVQSCVDDGEVATGTERIQFTFNVSQDKSSGRSTASILPEGAYVSISLNNSNGTPVFTNHHINIMTFGDGYATEPLELQQGRYTLTDFAIVSGSQIMYATPKNGSPLARVVEHPLPYSFFVSKNKVAKVPMQVLSASGAEPQDFGYASFSPEVVNVFQIAVFEANAGNIMLISAEASIMKGDTLIEAFTLGAKVNTIAFAGDPGKKYTLVVKRDGHADYRKDFIYNDLIAGLNNKPLKVIFEQDVFEILLHSEGTMPFRLVLEGSGEVTVNWNDTASTTYTLPMNFETELSERWYNLRISGDIDQITRFEAFGYDTGIEQFEGLRYLKGLREFSPGWIEMNMLDLRENPDIVGIDLPFINLSGGIFLPEENYVRSITIETTANIVELVDNIYRNATTHNTQQGYVLIFDVYEPLPAQTKAKLQTLIDAYHWDISVADIFEPQ